MQCVKKADLQFVRKGVLFTFDWAVRPLYLYLCICISVFDTQKWKLNLAQKHIFACLLFEEQMPQTHKTMSGL